AVSVDVAARRPNSPREGAGVGEEGEPSLRLVVPEYLYAGLVAGTGAGDYVRDADAPDVAHRHEDAAHELCLICEEVRRSGGSGVGETVNSRFGSGSTTGHHARRGGGKDRGGRFSRGRLGRGSCAWRRRGRSGASRGRCSASRRGERRRGPRAA